LQTTWLERSIVNGRVALLLRSVEIQLLFERFVRLRGSLAFSIPPFPLPYYNSRGIHRLAKFQTRRGPREWHSSQPATPGACSLASEAFRCHPLAVLPAATSTGRQGQASRTGHSPGSSVLPAQLPLQPTFAMHRLPGLHAWPIPVFPSQPSWYSRGTRSKCPSPPGVPVPAPRELHSRYLHYNTLPIDFYSEGPYKAPSGGGASTVDACHHPFNKCLPA
jgi:hypothetical protein